MECIVEMIGSKYQMIDNFLLMNYKLWEESLMALFYLVRHGQPDYSPCDERGYRGHGRDLAPLSEEGIRQAELTAQDERLIGADIIVSSPYTRALQTAAIISKNTDINITVEVDLHEWMPDLTFQYKNFAECLELTNDFNKYKGVYPEGEVKRWESLYMLRHRVRKVVDKYSHYDKVILNPSGQYRCLQ